MPAGPPRMCFSGDIAVITRSLHSLMAMMMVIGWDTVLILSARAPIRTGFSFIAGDLARTTDRPVSIRPGMPRVLARSTSVNR